MITILFINNLIAFCLLLNLLFFARFLSASEEYLNLCKKTAVLVGNFRFLLYSQMKRFWEVIHHAEDSLVGRKTPNINYFQF